MAPSSPAPSTPVTSSPAPPAVDGRNITCCQVAAAIRGASVDSMWAGRDALVAFGYQVLDRSGPSYRFTAWWSNDDGGSWHPARHDVHGPIAAVAAGGGFNGVGYEIYASPTGQTWRTGPPVHQARGIQLGFISDVARTPDGLLGVGTIYKHDRFDSYRSPGACVSRDGRAWQALPPPKAPYEAHFDAVAVGGPGVVVVGYGGGGEGGLAGVWTSVDGRAYGRVVDPAFADALTFDVAAGADRRLVVVGAAEGGLRAAAWTSIDGVAWTAATDIAGFAQAGVTGEMRDVVALPGGGFAASGTLGGLPALWTSEDGLAWRRVALTGPARWALSSAGASGFTALLVRGDRLLVAGNDLRRRRAVFLVADLGRRPPARG